MHLNNPQTKRRMKLCGYDGAYSGEVNEDGVADGEGELVTDDGSIFEGSFMDDRMHGGVTLKQSDGSASVYSEDIYVNEGVMWNEDRSEAQFMFKGSHEEVIDKKEVLRIMAKLGVTKIPERYSYEEDRA